MTMNRNVALLVLLGLTSVALGSPEEEEFEAVKAECVAKLGMDPAAIEQFDETRSPDPKMKCFGACLMEEYEEFNEDGTMNIEKGIENLPSDIPNRDKVVEAIKECGTKKGENNCETAHQIFACLHGKLAQSPSIRK